MVSFLSRKRADIPFSWILLLGVAVVFFWMNSLPAAERHEQFWRFKVWSYNERYCDTSAMLAWMDLDHKGIDTRFHCPTCPCFDTPMNYGAGVLWIGRLGLYRITPQGVYWVGPFVVALFLGALAWVFADAALWQVLFYSLLLFSPPVFLALERANLDIAIFSLLALAVYLESRVGVPWAYAAVVAAGALKYYPFAAAAAFFRATRRGWLYAALFGAAFVLFVYTTRGYIATARQPADVWRIGWGYPVLFRQLPEILKNHQIAVPGWIPYRLYFPLLLCGACAGSMMAILWFARRQLALFLGPHRPARTLFVLGAVLYTALFVVSSNYEYRSVFLFFLAPLLFASVAEKDFRRPLATVGLILVLAAFTLAWFRANDWLYIAHQVSYWMLFCFCGTLSLAAMLSAFAHTEEVEPSAMVTTRAVRARVRKPAGSRATAHRR
jgi:hypothetical protein